MRILVLLLFINCTIVSAQYFENKKSMFDYEHSSGGSNDYYYPEIVGSGVAVIDYDKDGDLDVYFIQSGDFNKNKKADKIYKNLLSETGELKFKNVSQEANVDQKEYGIGIAIDDVNQDGWDDILLLQLHQNKLLLNQKGKKFIVKEEFKSVDAWSASASFCDINNDGLKDLYIANYVQWSEQNNPKCFNSKSKRDYCGPSSFKGWKDEFYMNYKDKGLVLSTEKFFPNMPELPGLNVVCRDINSDGFDDFVVANDGEKNLVWINQKGTGFKEYGLFSGLAVNFEGKPEASMGIATSDFDLDGDIDIFFTHLMDETNTLYKNNGKGFFQDVSNKSKLAQDSKAYTGWATGFLHVNDDIYPDLIVFNGAVSDTYEHMEKSSLSQPNQLYLNSDKAEFSLMTEKSFNIKKSSRGATFADIDNDGDTDIIVNNNDEGEDLYLNQLNPKKWIGLEIISHLNLTIYLKNNQKSQILNINNDGSYASSNDNRIVVNEAQLRKFSHLLIKNENKIIKEIALNKFEPANSYKKLVIE